MPTQATKPPSTPLLLRSGNANASYGSPMSTPESPQQQSPPHHHERTLGAVAIAFLTFAQVAGSPVGIEDAVGAGGAFGCVILLAMMAVLWAAPQALITAELSTAFPVGGGAVVWVDEALGPVVGTANAWLVRVGALCDLPMYPLLFSQTVGSMWPALAGPVPSACLALALLAASVAVNACGAEAMAASTEWLTAIILVPFVAMPVVAAAYSTPLNAGALGPAGVPQPLALAALVSSVQWNMMGWGSVGALAAEARDPGRSFPRGVLAAVALVTAAYAWPVLWGFAVDADTADWEDGTLPVVAGRIAPWLGSWMFASAALAGATG